MSDHREIYNFDDFTLKEYSLILDTAKRNFNFCDFSNYSEFNNFVIWRHDVDYSVHAALELARIENSKKIKANYFILLHSEFYNIFEKEIYNKILEISKLGHFISLHFDASFYGINSKEELESKLKFEINILENLFDIKVLSFSFHNPRQEDLMYQESLYSGLINVYSEEIKNKATYCSDSNGYWRFKRLKDIINSKDVTNLQVLTHPEWWKENVMSPLEKVHYCIDGRAMKNKLDYEKLLLTNNRKIIDWK